jgi:hypothetical protein
MLNAGARRTAGLAVHTLTALLGTAALVGLANEAHAQTADRILPCTLTSLAVTELSNSLIAAGIPATPPPEIAFVVVYSLSKPNDGQAIATGTTGPALCKNSNVVAVTNPGVVTETTPIPSPNPDNHNVDILGVETVVITQYQNPSAQVPNPSTWEKRLCHSVANNNDCFTITPSSSQ